MKEIDIKEIAAQCLKDEAQALIEIIPQLSDDFENAIKAIYECKGKLVVTGVGKSGHIGAKIAATLSSTGTPSFYISPLDLYHGDLGVITNQDIVLAISNSGQTDELLRFIPYLKKKKITLIGMSGNPKSLLAHYSNYHIQVKVQQEACPLHLAPTSSTTAQLALGDAIACALMKLRNFKETDFAQFHPGGTLGKKLLATARDIMRTNDLPIISPNANLAEAIILISNNKMGMAVVTQDEKVVGIITDGDIRRSMLQLKEEFFHVTVSEIMTTNPRFVSPDTKMEEIQHMLHEFNIHAVLVLNEKSQLIGIVDFLSCL